MTLISLSVQQGDINLSCIAMYRVNAYTIH